LTGGSASTPALFFTGDANTGIYSPAADTIAFAEGGVEAARIDSSGRLLVGTSTARSQANVTAALQLENTDYDGLSLAVNNNSALVCPILTMGKSRGSSLNSSTIVASEDRLGGIFIQGADGTDLNTLAAGIEVFVDGTPGSNDMPGRLVFSTATDASPSVLTERMRITSTGQVRLAGAGITFNGDTATANELDDYEEGTFTPTIVGVTTAGTGTYSIQVGRYTKTGNRVNFTVYVVWSAHTGTGDMRVGALPFTSSAATNVLHAVSIWQTTITLTAGNVMMGYVLGSNTQVALSQTPTGGGTQTTVAMDGSGNIIITGVYEV
jgi:hypothetical protein